MKNDFSDIFVNSILPNILIFASGVMIPHAIETQSWFNTSIAVGLLLLGFFSNVDYYTRSEVAN